MEIVIACSLALNIVMWLIIRSLKRQVKFDEGSLITLFRALDKLNVISKNICLGKGINECDRTFLYIIDTEIEKEKAKHNSKINA